MAGIDGTKVITSGDAPLNSRRKRRFIYAAIVIVAILLAGAAFMYVRHSRSSDAPVTSDQQQDSADTVSDIATEYAVEGKYDEAQDILDDNIATAKDAATRGRLYETKSLIAYNAKQYKDALVLATQAEKIHPNRNTSYLVAIAAEALGNKKQAIKYYQLTADRTTSYEKDEYLKKVEELSK